MKVLSIFFLLLSFSGFSQDNVQPEFIGDWIFDYENSLELMDEAAKLHYAKMDVISQANVEQAYQNRILIFNSDGNFIQVLSNGLNTEAKWTFDNERNIIIRSSSGQIISFNILEISANHMILAPQNDNSKANMLFSRWSLIKR